MIHTEKCLQTTFTQRVTKVDMPPIPIVRITVRTQQEAELYLSKGVAVYQEVMTISNGTKRVRYYIEVSVYDIAEIARKA
jgi:hypothetical protein